MLNYFAKQPLDGFKGADLEKKCNRLDAFSIDSEVDETMQLQAIRLADGNPLLLERLDKIVRDKILDRQKILDPLEKIPVKLREEVLAKCLLQQIDDSMRELLSRGLVFELSVPREAIKTVCESISEVDEKIDRAIALGLLEVSPDESLRVPRILPIQLPEDRDILSQQAAEVLYLLWWSEGHNFEYKAMEIYRLATIAKIKDIAADIGYSIAGSWVTKLRYSQAYKLCNKTLELGKDYRILATIARAEKFLNWIDDAKSHFEEALELCPDEDITMKALILNNMADLIATQGNIEEALLLWQQSKELFKQIPDLRGEICTLNNIADAISSKNNNIEQALSFWWECIELYTKIKEKEFWDIRGQALVYHNIASVMLEKKGDIKKAEQLWQKTLENLQEISSYADLVMIIASIGRHNIDNSQVYFAQAIWLSLKLEEFPIARTFSMLIEFYQKLSPEDILTYSIGRTIIHLCNGCKQEEPQLQDFHDMGYRMLKAAAQAQNIPEEEVNNWIVQQRLNDPNYFLPELFRHLEAIIGNEWLFDRTVFKNPN